jgi:uncharacterized protein (DUF342 family)
MAGQLLHCIVRASGEVAAGGPTQRAGKLVGGIIKGSKTIVAGTLGCPANSRTRLDFSEVFMEHELSMQKLNQEIEVKRQLFLDLYGLLTATKKKAKGKKVKVSPEMVKMKNTVMVLKDEVKEMVSQVETIKSEMIAERKNLNVTVAHRLYPGVECVIYADRYKVSVERGVCSIQFDEAGMIFE